MTKFNVNEWVPRVQEVAKQLDSYDVNLAPFEQKGGKMILTTGLADDGIGPENTIAFYDHQVSKLGRSDLSRFVKFYTMPGFSHGFGNFNATYDALPAIMNWVEKGQAPRNLTMTDANTADNGRTRPLCEYPSWPKYTGKDANQASSFTCVGSTN